MWDRWDDAMDDAQDELRELRRENERLEERLREFGAPVPSMDPPDLAEVSDHNDMYRNRLTKVFWHRRRKKKLEEALRKAEDTSS